MVLREGLSYTKLNQYERQAYKIILSAVSSMAIDFDASQIHPSIDLMKIFNAVLGDNPSVIYFNKTAIQTVGSAFDRQIELVGVIPKNQANKMSAELNEKAEQIVLPLKNKARDEYSALIAIYEFLQSNVRYDKQELKAMSGEKSNNPFSHNAYGALVNGIAVCDGFSATFSLLAEKIGFDSMLVVGESTQSSAAFVEHSWNLVKVNNKYYHMDTTWDAKKYHDMKDFAYSYFAITDDDIANDHDWDINSTPVCSYNDLSYFLRNGLFANSMSQCDSIILSSLRKGYNTIRLRLSSTIPLPKNSEEHLLGIFTSRAGNCGISKRFEYYWNEITRCFYAKFLT